MVCGGRARRNERTPHGDEEKYYKVTTARPGMLRWVLSTRRNGTVRRPGRSAFGKVESPEVKFFGRKKDTWPPTRCVRLASSHIAFPESKPTAISSLCAAMARRPWCVASESFTFCIRGQGGRERAALDRVCDVRSQMKKKKTLNNDGQQRNKKQKSHATFLQYDQSRTRYFYLFAVMILLSAVVL